MNDFDPPGPPPGPQSAPIAAPSAAATMPPVMPASVSAADDVALFRYALFAQAPRAWVTPALVAANVIVFLAMVATGVAVMSPTVESLLHWGANYGPRTMSGQWWRLLSNTFVHVGAIHIAMNMIGLWQIGGLVERLLRARSFVLVYLVSGLCGSLASLAWNPLVVSAGASGAVFGVYGSLIAYLVRHRKSIPREMSSSLQKSMLFFIGLNLLFGFQQKGIDMAAHVGGLVAGFGACLIVARPLTIPAARRQAWREGLVAVLAFVILGAAGLFLPRPPDIQAELEQFRTVERRAVDTYNAALERRGKNELSDHDMAKLVDEQVLPPWREYRIHVGTLKNLPPEHAKRIADLEKYMTLREQGWSSLSRALRTDDEKQALAAQRLQQQAEALMKAGNDATDTGGPD